MSRSVHWTRSSLDDLRAQIAYIAADSPAAARKVATSLRQTAEALGVRATGRPGRVNGTYEKSVSRLPYIIAYAIGVPSDPEAVVILRVIHTARDWPAEHWPE